MNRSPPMAPKPRPEVSVASALLDRIDWHDRVLTGDAVFCQRDVCQQVCAAGGNYLLLVKHKQPPVHDAIPLSSPTPPPISPPCRYWIGGKSKPGIAVMAAATSAVT